jgi:hypothetical protein
LIWWERPGFEPGDLDRVQDVVPSAFVAKAVVTTRIEETILSYNLRFQHRKAEIESATFSRSKRATDALSM